MPRIIMNHAFIARWTRTRHSIGRLSASASSHHSLSSAAFITNIAESDFRHAHRIPMVIGNPSPTPVRTRNPARGFMNIRSEIVVALCDQGLRWGACDFGVSPDESSQNIDMMHFDLADDGGFPRIN